MVSSNSIALILHLLSDHSILVLSLLFFLMFSYPLLFSDLPVIISLADILIYYTGFYRLWHHLSHIFFPSYAFNALVSPFRRSYNKGR